MSDLIERLAAEIKAMRAAPSGEQVGNTPHVANWADKPHRVVYDACRLLEEAISELSRLQSLSDQNRLTGGWRAVPDDPDEKMLRAARDVPLNQYPGFSDFGAIYRAMLAASPPLPDTGGWRDIESAPKDGTPILAWCVHPHARYATDDKDWSAPVVTQWINHNGGGWTWNGMAGTFTHWRELPSPPLPLPGGEEKR